VNKILVIEDHAPMRRNLMMILEMEGFQAIGAEDGRKGLELARQETPDLILCDVMMPELDGYSVLQSLREDSRTANIPFIFLTARGERDDMRFGMNSGADDYLTKPVEHEELLAAIQARLSRRRDFEPDAGHIEPAAAGRPDLSSPARLLTLGLNLREAEVLLWMAQGKSDADIGRSAGISEQSLRNHLAQILAKLGAENREGAVAQALEFLGSRR
jgi:DNA-binding NarL/FixJ family response regulator